MSTNKMSIEELRNLDGFQLVEKMKEFKGDYISSMDEDDPEREWSCLISMVEDQDVKFDDLPSYGFYYLDEEKMREKYKENINFHLNEALKIAKNAGLTKNQVLEKLNEL